MGAIWSSPMHTPTPITRENSGAEAITPSRMPGTSHALEDHRALGLDAERVDRAPHVVPGDRQAPELLRGRDRELDRVRQRLQVTAIAGRVRRLLRGVDHDVGAAPRSELAPRGGEVAGHDRADTAGLEQADHGQADRAAADHDRHVALADLAAPHRVPADRHRLGQRAQIGRKSRWAPAASATPRPAPARRRRRAPRPRGQWRAACPGA